jgi:7-cyano-7-deazaguanine synthase
MKNKLIIISGGMDSVTLLYKERQNIKLALSFYYGQKHNKELNFAELNCKELNIKWHKIDISNILPYLKSDLLITGNNIPEGYYEDESMKRTVVPFRNGIMLSIACGIAESNDCKHILIANHAGDHTIYPDCRNTFIQAMDKAMFYGTYKNINIQAPFTYINKKQIALVGKELNIDYGNKTWTCYKGNRFHCGKCGSCTERKEALKGFDNTVYE